MLNFFLAFLRLRTLIILAIIYFFLSISSNGKLTLQVPNFQNISTENLTKGLQDAKSQIANLFNKKGNENNKSDGSSFENIKKTVNDFLNSDKSKN